MRFWLVRSTRAMCRLHSIKAGSHGTDKYVHEPFSLVFVVINPPIRYPFGKHSIRTSIRPYNEDAQLTSHKHKHQEKHA
jgi:hypothetical protein